MREQGIKASHKMNQEQPIKDKVIPQDENSHRECQGQPMASQDSQYWCQAHQEQPIREEGT